MKTKFTIALVGQPNVGKSQLLNAISGANLKVGNFSGVTVEKHEASIVYENMELHFIDLPGLYSLDDFSKDETITREFLETSSNYDVILNVVDSTNLERNLYLSSELMAMNKKMVIALNMDDEAQKEGISIDKDYLSEILNILCVKVSSTQKTNIEKLINTIVTVCKFPYEENKFSLSEDLDSLRNKYPNLTDEEILLDEYQAFAKGAALESTKKKKNDVDITKRLDDILIHKYFGVPIFLLMMWLLFQATFTLGEIPMGWIEEGFAFLGDNISAHISNDTLRSIVVDGMIAGVGTVILFLPNIMILFLGIALLETTGYMARVAFLLDGFFHKFGLHGKSFIPLVTGFGCSIPAYMSARTLKSEKDRLLTMFIIGFMSCGARLPVYVLFAGAFFAPENAGNVLFAIYISGVFLGLIAAKILRLTAFKGADEPFVMEMPKYRLPSLRLIWMTIYTKSLMYLKKAGTFILAASILVWFISSYPKNTQIEEHYNQLILTAATEDQKNDIANEMNQKMMESTYLGMIGKTIEPIFAPLGMDWKMSVATVSGLAAKEVIVSTLGVLYALGDDVAEDDATLQETLAKNISFASALAFIVFVMVYLPCLAATAVFSKEAGKRKYTFYLVVFTFSTAWFLAFITYHIASII